MLGKVGWLSVELAKVFGWHDVEYGRAQACIFAGIACETMWKVPPMIVCRQPRVMNTDVEHKYGEA